MEVFDVVWRYRSIVLLCHIPTIRIVFRSTRDIRSDIAPPARWYHLLMSWGVKPIAGPISWTMVQMAAVISVL